MGQTQKEYTQLIINRLLPRWIIFQFWPHRNLINLLLKRYRLAVLQYRDPQTAFASMSRPQLPPITTIQISMSSGFDQFGRKRRQSRIAIVEMPTETARSRAI